MSPLPSQDRPDSLSAGDTVETPCLTPCTLSVGGRYKCEPEDFVVEEIPAYSPSGTGEHLYLWIQKRDVSCEQLVAHLSRQLNINRNDIGTAGLKDRRAVTRQWVSVPAACESRIGSIDTDVIQVLDVSRHENKLKTGHLQGNRFDLVIRNVASDALPVAQEIASILRQQGVPNYYGEQRFGQHNETLTLGLQLLRGEANSRKIPFSRRKFLTRLALSAVQSSLFNAVLAERMKQNILHTVLPGDVMQVIASGGLFIVEDAAAEQIRFDQGETVITGPLFGPKMKSPVGEPFHLEAGILKLSGLDQDHFRAFRKLTPGTRRPLLIRLTDLEIESEQCPTQEQVDSKDLEHKDSCPCQLRLRFSLPSGAYATVVLNEFIKGS